MSTKPVTDFCFARSNPGFGLPFGCQNTIVNAIGCLGMLALVFSFAPALQAQQSGMANAKKVQAKPATAQPLLTKEAYKKGPYSKLITGKFSHAPEPLVEAGLPLWVFGSQKMMDGKKRYPLLIVLHGRRNKVKPGAKFTPQGIATPWVQKQVQGDNPCFVVQPYYPPKGGWEKIPESLDATVDHLMQNLPIDRNRVYVMGFSNGAQGTFQALARSPDRYAAAITVSGPVGAKSVVGRIKTPIRAWVGENDTSLNKNSRCIALAKALKESGVDIELVVVEGAGHACHRVATQDPKVHKWLFSKTLEVNVDGK